MKFEEKKNGKQGIPFKHSEPLRAPIAATVAFEFESFEHCADTYGHRVRSHAYSRLSNPTLEALEQKMTARCSAVESIAFASGMGAVSALYLGLSRPGDNIVSSARLYGGTIALQQRLQEFGIEFRYADFNDAQAVESRIDDRTVMLFSEPIANPSMDWYDYELIYQLAQKHGVLCALDNTNTVALFDSLRYCDVDVTSATKYVGGHGAGLGGLAICGPFDLSKERYAGIDKPSGDFGGKRPGELGVYGLPSILRGSQLRNFGACMSPFNAYMFSLGLDTLDLRMPDISRKTLALAQLCAAHPAVELVMQAELGPKAKGIERYFAHGTGGLYSFKLRGDMSAVKKFFDALTIIPVATNIGDARTIVQHVETTSHSQCSKEQLTAAGIPTGLLRVSVGLEKMDDLLAEFTRALDAAAAINARATADTAL